MIVPRSRAHNGMCVLLGVFIVLVGHCTFGAEDAVGVTEITTKLLVFSTTAGNVVASIGPDGALLVGTPPITSTPSISSVLTSRTKSPVRYVVIAPQGLAHSEGDAGWGRRGAFVAMQENALRRLDGDTMGAPPPLSPRFVKLGVDRPRIAFSEVLAFDLNGESIHVVHQKPGYSDADAIVHFHLAKLVSWSTWARCFPEMATLPSTQHKAARSTGYSKRSTHGRIVRSKSCRHGGR
jgi:hypothetical protein